MEGKSAAMVHDLGVRHGGLVRSDVEPRIVQMGHLPVADLPS